MKSQIMTPQEWKKKWITACKEGDLETLKSLCVAPEVDIKKFQIQDVHANNEEGLRQALIMGKVEVLKWLLESEEILKIENQYPGFGLADASHERLDSALLEAIDFNQWETIRYLKELSERSTRRQHQIKWTAKHWSRLALRVLDSSWSGSVRKEKNKDIKSLNGMDENQEGLEHSQKEEEGGSPQLQVMFWKEPWIHHENIQWVPWAQSVKKIMEEVCLRGHQEIILDWLDHYSGDPSKIQAIIEDGLAKALKNGHVELVEAVLEKGKEKEITIQCSYQHWRACVDGASLRSALWMMDRLDWKVQGLHELNKMQEQEENEARDGAIFNNESFNHEIEIREGSSHSSRSYGECGFEMQEFHRIPFQIFNFNEEDQEAIFNHFFKKQEVQKAWLSFKKENQEGLNQRLEDLIIMSVMENKKSWSVLWKAWSQNNIQALWDEKSNHGNHGAPNVQKGDSEGFKELKKVDLLQSCALECLSFHDIQSLESVIELWVQEGLDWKDCPWAKTWDQGFKKLENSLEFQKRSVQWLDRGLIKLEHWDDARREKALSVDAWRAWSESRCLSQIMKPQDPTNDDETTDEKKTKPKFKL